MNSVVSRELRAIVGDANVLEAKEDLICYSCDSTFRDALPDVVVRPGSTEEIVAIVKLAHRYHLPVTPRGASTGLSGGAVAVQGGILLELTRLNKILAIDVANRTATVEPGVITDEFTAAVERAGLFYPPDPASGKMSTFGGNIAECAGGPRGVKYGVTRDYLLGLEVVLPDGTVVQTGNAVDGEMCGPDWTMLFCASEGTLGIITKITVKLVDKPPGKWTMLAIFDHIEDAATTVSTMIAAGTIPTTLEIMDNLTICAVENYLQIGLPTEAEAILLIEVNGSPAVLDKQARQVVEVCRRCGAKEVKVAKTKAESDVLWQARRAISPACGKINPTKISEDATVPRSQIPAMVAAIRDIANKYNLKMVIFGHAGDGNLHPNILANKHDADEMARVEQAVEELFRRALALGGTLSGEHGIGFMKAPFLPWETGDVGFKMGRAIKDTVDPAHLLNPGKMFDIQA